MAPKLLADFQAWMASVGIHHSDAIQLVEQAEGCSGLALGVRAVRDIAEGERLCTIPKAACISIRTTQLADVIEAEELGGGLGLVLAVMHEMSLGRESKWHGYFQALPRREYLPLFWSGEELRMLQGTELERSVEADREAAAEDFREHVLPLLDKYPGRLRAEGCTLDSFRVAASLVASRAFGVDEWHGDAMVPLADIFNHKASVVELGAGYEVHGAHSSGSDSDSEGGHRGSDGEQSDRGSGGARSDSEAGENYDDDEEEEEEEEANEAAEGGGCAAAGCSHRHQHSHRSSSKQQHQHHDHAGCCGGSHDGQQHGRLQQGREQEEEQQEGRHAGGEGGDSSLPAVMAQQTASIYGLTSAHGLHLRLEMGIVDRDEDTLEIVAASAVPAGAEVHNTYGELGNAELVKKYGFALRQNPFTAVPLDKAALLQAAKQRLGVKRWKARSRLLREETEVLEEDEEPFEALPNGHVSPALFVALRVLCATDEEAASWRSIGDALRLPAAAGKSGGGVAGGGSSEGDGKEGLEKEGVQEEEDEQPELGAVQVWRVLASDGQPLLAAAGPGGAPAAAGSQQKESQQGQQQESQQQDEQGSAERYSALLNRDMCELLREAAQLRLGAYEADLGADLRQLQALEQPERQAQGEGVKPHSPAGKRGGGQSAKAKAASTKRQHAGGAAGAALGEKEAAERAALLLRTTEKEVLRDLLAAVERRLAALPPDRDLGKQADESSGEKAQSKVKAKQQQQQQQQPAASKGKRKAAAEDEGQQEEAGRSKGSRGKRSR